MNKIEQLLEKLNTLASEKDTVQSELQEEYNKVFNNSPLLKEMISKLEESQDYMLDEAGEIISYIVRYELEEFEACQEYLETWFEDQGIRVYWDSNMLSFGQGESLIIQDDARHKRDNGVWIYNKKVIDESEYLDEKGNVDEAKRNRVIEANMKQQGFYPGVFKVDRHGNVSLVNTRA